MIAINSIALSSEDISVRLFYYNRETINGHPIVTDRQLDLLKEVLAGKTIKEIAKSLNVKHNSVIQQFHNIKKKLLPYVAYDRAIATLLAYGLNNTDYWKKRVSQEKND